MILKKSSEVLILGPKKGLRYDLTSCVKSENSIEPILRKQRYRWPEGWTVRWKDRSESAGPSSRARSLIRVGSFALFCRELAKLQK